MSEHIQCIAKANSADSLARVGEGVKNVSTESAREWGAPRPSPVANENWNFSPNADFLFKQKQFLGLSFYGSWVCR